MRYVLKQMSKLVLAACLGTPVIFGACQATRPAALEVPTVNSEYQIGVKLLYNAQTRFQYPKAVEHLKTALAANPEDVDTQFALIYAYLKRSDYINAKSQADKLQHDIGSLSENQRLWFNAMNARINDQSSQEVEAWKRVIKSNPKDRWAWYELSTVQAVMENYSNAADSAEKALQIEPDPKKWEASWIYYLLSKAYYRSGQFDKAIHAGLRGHKNKTTWRSTYFRQFLAELKSGKTTNHEDIVAGYIDISNKEGRNSLTYTYANIALFYHELGDLDNAEIYAQKSYNRDRGAYPSWVLGFIQADNGKAEEALTMLTTSVQASPSNNYLHAAKAWALYRLGRLEEAQTEIEAALKYTKRKNYSLLGMAREIGLASENPKAIPAPPIPWLG